jgi:hypothetical protein
MHCFPRRNFLSVNRHQLVARASLCRLKVSPSAILLACAVAFGALLDSSGASAEPKKHYWATSLTRSVDSGLLQGLREAVGRGEVGWLDIEPKYQPPEIPPGTNLIFYHVGGNCYVGADCARFSSSQPIGGHWGDRERKIELNDPATRAIVVADLVRNMQYADQLAPKGSSIGVHLDNIHKYDPEALARIFNDYLQAVDAAKQQGLIAKDRSVGYIAKNNPRGFGRAIEQLLLERPPFYLIFENATLSQDGTLDRGARAAQNVGARFGIPVFLKTFGTDVAYTTEQNGKRVDVFASPEMTKQMAQLPDIAGAAWSPDERRYHPVLFAQGSAVQQVLIPSRPRPRT